MWTFSCTNYANDLGKLCYMQCMGSSDYIINVWEAVTISSSANQAGKHASSLFNFIKENIKINEQNKSIATGLIYIQTY